MRPTPLAYDLCNNEEVVINLPDNPTVPPLAGLSSSLAELPRRTHRQRPPLQLTGALRNGSLWRTKNEITSSFSQQGRKVPRVFAASASSPVGAQMSRQRSRLPGPLQDIALSSMANPASSVGTPTYLIMTLTRSAIPGPTLPSAERLTGTNVASTESPPWLDRVVL